MITLCSSSPKTYEPTNLLSCKENGTSPDVVVSMVREMGRVDPSISTYFKQMIGLFNQTTNEADSKHEFSSYCLGVSSKIVSGLKKFVQLAKMPRHPDISVFYISTRLVPASSLTLHKNINTYREL